MVEDSGVEGGAFDAAAAMDADVLDAQILDAAPTDADIRDAEIAADAEVMDAEVMDAEVVDAAAADAAENAGDASDDPVDGGTLDAQLRDAEGVDAEVGDAEIVDAEIADAEAVDAAQDTGGSDADAGDYDGFEPDFVAGCLAGLQTNDRGDAIRMEGVAGSLGDVDYTIWGLSGGSYSGSGFGLVASDGFGREGTPASITGAGVTFTPFPLGTAVQTGITYRADSDLIEGGDHYMLIRIIPDASTPFTNCGPGGSGLIRFTRYEGISADHPVIGVYAFACDSIGLDVRGCFRFGGEP